VSSSLGNIVPYTSQNSARECCTVFDKNVV
jgi:hypothetical protein